MYVGERQHAVDKDSVGMIQLCFPDSILAWIVLPVLALAPECLMRTARSSMKSTQVMTAEMTLGALFK